MADGKEAKSVSYTTVLGSEASNAEFEVTFQECDRQNGLHYDCVSINPLDSAQPEPPKTVQVTYKQDDELKGNLKFTTVAVHETPREIDDTRTVSKVVKLCEQQSRQQMRAQDEEADDEDEAEIFASDPEALKFIRLARQQANPQASTKPKVPVCGNNEEPEGVFASDPDALKFVKLLPRTVGQTAAATSQPEMEGVFASDPDALKFVQLQPQRAASHATSQPEMEGVFASDPDALKFVQLQPREAASSDSPSEAEGVFVSDPEALKFISLVPKPRETGGDTCRTAETFGEGDLHSRDDDGSEGVFVSDPEALKFLKFTPKCPGSRQPTGGVFCDADAVDSRAGDVTTGQQAPDPPLLSETRDLQLKDDAVFNVRVSGQPMTNGLHKKVVDVSSSSSAGPAASVDVSKLQVSVEEKVNPNGTVEKFVVVE